MLLSVVYSCQKSFNFINGFASYKQKCKLALFNLAHPVGPDVNNTCSTTSLRGVHILEMSVRSVTPQFL